jgi:hypothetical protein
MMNLGEGESQMVEFSPALPNLGAFFFRICRLQQTTRVKNGALGAQFRQLIELIERVVGRYQESQGAHGCPCIKWVWTPLGLRDENI